MHILHITGYCHAGSLGGTERYILELIQGLDRIGISNTIGWLQKDCSGETLASDGVRIVTLPSPPMRVDSPVPEFYEAAEQLLTKEDPDLLHFHTFGLSEAALAKMAKQRGIPYAFTYHSPAWTCRRETMLLYGKVPCDGEVRAWRCSVCQSEERLGLGQLAGHGAAAASMAIGWTTMPSGITPLRRRSAFFYDTLRYGRRLRHFLGGCDLVVSCCDWSGPVLRRNGAREEHMVHCAQGVPGTVATALQAERKNCAETKATEFVIGYVGRLVEVKGVHILMEAFSRLAEKEVRLRVVGWEPENAALAYARRIQKMAESDSRIELIPKTTFATTVAEYQKLSLLAIPSIWLETGPLTLLEALSMSIPVYGSNRIGQLDLLREFGQIVEPNTPDAWHAALTRALLQWRQGGWNAQRKTSLMRTMAEVATQMATWYRRVITN